MDKIILFQILGKYVCCIESGWKLKWKFYLIIILAMSHMNINFEQKKKEKRMELHKWWTEFTRTKSPPS